MVSRRRPELRPPHHAFWKKDGNLWYCEREDLERAIAESGVTADELKHRMGFGHAHLGNALAGYRLSVHQVALVEYGFMKLPSVLAQSYCPDTGTVKT